MVVKEPLRTERRRLERLRDKLFWAYEALEPYWIVAPVMRPYEAPDWWAEYDKLKARGEALRQLCLQQEEVVAELERKAGICPQCGQELPGG